MVARDSPDWLPAGWSVQLSTLKTGRRVQNFVNMETGKKFSSKDDVLHYIKMVNAAHGKPLSTTNRHIERPSGRNPLKLINEKAKKPEWLPKGWKMELKTRKSGGRIGDDYKCYIDPSKRYKFYSKPGVFRYLSTVKHKNHMFKNKKTGISVPSAKKVVVDKKKAEDLPSRRTKEIRITRSSNEIKNDPVVVDKKKVEDLPPRWTKEIRITRSSNEIKNDMVVVDKKKVEDLPPRRTKEIRFTRSSNEIKNDPVAIDKKKVEDLPPRLTKEIRITRSSNQIKKDLPSSEAKRQKLKHPATRSQIFSGEKSSGMSDSEQSEIGVSKQSCHRKASTEAKVASAHGAEKHSLGNVIPDSSEAKQNCALGGSPQSKVEETKRNQGKRSLLSETDESKKSQGKSCIENGLASTPVPDMLQENNLIQSVIENQSFRKPRMNTGRSNNKKHLKLPRRSSKRLAGVEPDQVVKLVSAEQGHKVAIEKFSKTGAILDAGLSSNSMVDGESTQHEFGQETELAHHAFSGINTSSYGVSSNMSIKPSADQVAHGELKLNPESRKVEKEKPESPINLLFGSDPCLEFAFKTLTGDLPVTDAADGLANLSTTAGKLQDKNLHDGMKKSSDGTSLVHLKKSKKKKEMTLPKRSSKRLAGFEPELVAGSLAGEGELKNATRKSHKNGATQAEDLTDEKLHQLEPVLETELGNNLSPNIETSMHSEPSGKQCNNGHKVELANNIFANTDTLVHEELSNKQLDAGLETEFPNLNKNISMHEEPSNKQPDSGKEVEPANYLSNNIDVSTHGEPSNKSEKSPEDLVVPEKQPQVQGQIPDLEKPDPQVAFSLGDCWSDPCLDFAFKTLTGAIPIEDNLVQGYFQEQLDTSHSQRNGSLALPDFGSLGFFQSDISSHFDSPEKSASGQQLPTNSSFLPAGNANLPSCNVHSQQHCLESDKDYNGKVKS